MSCFSTPPKQSHHSCTPLAHHLSAPVPGAALRATPVCLPNPGDVRAGKFAVTIEDVLSPAECIALIEATESRGYDQALVNIGGGRQVALTELRKSSRCIVDDAAAAEIIWRRIRALVPEIAPQCAGWRAVGVNERLRFLRYGAGGYFRPHHDGCFQRGAEAAGKLDGRGAARVGERSYVTVQLYLNTAEEDEHSFRGGSTRFVRERPAGRGGATAGVDVAPVAGRALVFQHNLYHEGSTVRGPGGRCGSGFGAALGLGSHGVDVGGGGGGGGGGEGGGGAHGTGAGSDPGQQALARERRRFKYALRTDVMYTHDTESDIALLEYGAYPPVSHTGF